MKGGEKKTGANISLYTIVALFYNMMHMKNSHLCNLKLRLCCMCRDGVKKSGLYCAICNMLEGIDWYREVNVYHSVRQLQLRKPEAIKSKVI